MRSEALFMLTVVVMISSVAIIGAIGYLVARRLDRKHGTEGD